MPRILKPLYVRPSYSQPIARAIYDQLFQDIFLPLLEILKPSQRDNAVETALESALRRSVMEYRDGYFVGAYKAEITKELRRLGATYNHVRKVYYLELNKLPRTILQAIAAGKQSSSDVMDKVQKILTKMESKEVKATQMETLFGDTLTKLDKQFFVTTKPITGKDLEIPIMPHLAEKLKTTYTEDLKKYIQKWHNEQILRLREKITTAFSQGRRSENLLGIVQSEKRVSYDKARFLARQEIGLVTAKYTELRYADIGINDYIWSCSLDERVRPDHRRLHGHLFRFDHPPIVDSKTGRRGNPKEDYECRCVAIPYIRRGVNMVSPSMGGMDAALEGNLIYQ